jgi:ribosome biogenesis GTPase
MINLKQFGYTETDYFETNEAPPTDLIPARITACHRDQYTAVCQHGEITAVLKGSFFHETEICSDFPCVGEFVLLNHNPSGHSRIVRLLPRRTMFSRANFSGHAAGYAKTIMEQVVAANFDYVFITTSLNRDFRVSRIIRYLTQARQSKGTPVVILTKADLTDDFSAYIKEVNTAAPGVPVHAVSAHTGFGMEMLDEYMQPGKTVVFLGMSGVGKSSLLNALSGEDLMAVCETRREDASKGSHTTTHRQLFMLPSGAMVIDTPGMRELGLIDAGEAISATFSHVEALFTGCRFSDCLHKTEPGCAVLKALSDGTLSHKEWESYQQQRRENKFVDDRAGFMREKDARGKSMAIHSRQQYKHSKKGKKR